MRESWEAYFMGEAQQASTRGTCPRRRVGCAVVRDNRIVVAKGYNGSPPGEPHCDDVGCDDATGHCERTTHAEINAIASAARYGAALDGCVAYVTLEPCYACQKALAAAGVRAVYFRDYYYGSGSVKRCGAINVLSFTPDPSPSYDPEPPHVHSAYRWFERASIPANMIVYECACGEEIKNPKLPDGFPYGRD